MYRSRRYSYNNHIGPINVQIGPSQSPSASIWPQLSRFLPKFTKIKPNLYKIYTKGCFPMYNRPWDVSGIVNRPSGINFALEFPEMVIQTTGNSYFSNCSLSLVLFCFFGMLWHALACFGMLWHALSSIVIQKTPGHKGDRPQGTKERDPRAQRREAPGHKGERPQGTKAQSIGRPEGRLVPGDLGGKAPQ